MVAIKIVTRDLAILETEEAGRDEDEVVADLDLRGLILESAIFLKVDADGKIKYRAA